MIDSLRLPIAFHLTLGEVADWKAYDALIGRSNRCGKIDHDWDLYRQCNLIERMFEHLMINRAIATR